MTDTSPPTRRATLIAALAAAGGARAAANTSAQPATTARDPALAARAHDWDWLVDPGVFPGYSSPFEKSLTEGRWIGYWWSLITVHLSPKIVTALFLSFFAASCSFLQRIAPTERLAPLVAIVLFFSPEMAFCRWWPANLASSVILLSVMTYCLGFCRTFWHYSILVAAAGFLAPMSYPSIGGVVLVATLVCCKGAEFRRMAMLIAFYGASFALAVLFVSFLNLVFHGHFGIQIANWRNPNPLRSWVDLQENLRRYGVQLTDLWAGYRWAIILLATAVVASFLNSSTRTVSQRITSSLIAVWRSSSATVPAGASMLSITKCALRLRLIL